MTPAPRATLLFARLSALFTLLTVAGGAVVCATKSGFDCHAWPGCYVDRFAPGPADIPAALVANPALEMVHRVIAMSTGGLLIVTALLVLRLKTPVRTVKILPWIACLAAGVSALYGRAAVLGLGVDALGAAIDLLAALIAMGLSLVTAVALGRGGRFTLGPVACPALLGSTLLILTYVSGHLAAGDRSFTRCMSWPILWLASDDGFFLQVVRTGFAAAAAVVLVVAIRAALVRGVARWTALALAGLLVATVALGFAYRASGTDGGVLGIAFSLASVGVLWTTLLLGARASLAAPATKPAAAALVDA